MKSIDMTYTHDDWQYRIAEKKLALSLLPFSLRESVDIRARGGSKTWDTMCIALYLASLGFEGIWFAAVAKQMEQPKKYLKRIIERSYLKYLVSPGCFLRESVVFETGGELRIYNLTEDNARSPRCDFVVYDEEARADRVAYDAATSIVSNSQLGLIFHISTPAKATVFEENYDRIKRREIIHNEVFTFKKSWNEISFLARKKDWYEEEKRVKPDWYFRQEHMAEFTLPMGAVFQNVVYGPYPPDLIRRIEDMPNCSGIDWNPAAGHTRSTVKWTPDYLHVVVVGEAIFSLGYARELREKEFMALAPWFTNGNRLVAETGGVNIPFIDWFEDMIEHFRFNWRQQRWNAEEWDSAGLNKMQTINYILQQGVTIWVDKMRFPETARQIEDCQWDEDATGEPRIKKDSANSPHFVDAFLHAISDKNRDDLMYEVAEW